LSPLTYHMVDDGPDAVGYFSHAVEADGWLFFAGQIASGETGEPLPDGIEAQARKTLDNVVSVLKGVGCGVENVASVRIFLTDLEADWPTVNRIYQEYFPETHKPARTTVGVTALALGGLIEIDVVARRSDQNSG
jgi:2-iminobutanoate/2-iminopropanoate deaminase